MIQFFIIASIIILVIFSLFLFFLWRYFYKEAPRYGGDLVMSGEEWEAHKHRAVSTLIAIFAIFIAIILTLISLAFSKLS